MTNKKRVLSDGKTPAVVRLLRLIGRKSQSVGVEISNLNREEF